MSVMKTKSVISIILSVLMIVSVFACVVPANAAETSKTASGDEYGQLKYNYNYDTKTLTISGNGEMEKDEDDYPWQYYDAEKVIIGDGVKNISY